VLRIKPDKAIQNAGETDNCSWAHYLGCQRELTQQVWHNYEGTTPKIPIKHEETHKTNKIVLDTEISQGV
jgi:hypothetical protein